MDVARGLFALGVMFSHYLIWSAPDLTGITHGTAQKLSVYCVEGFFVLSGFSLY